MTRWPAGRRPRFGVRKVHRYGLTFDSGREADRYSDLRALEAAGKIRDLELQPRIPIVIGGVEVRYPPDKLGRRGHQMVYKADFKYFDIEAGEEQLEDVKMQSGHLPEIYRFKRALLHSMGITIKEI